MTCGLVHASYSLPKWQAVKLTFFARCYSNALADVVGLNHINIPCLIFSFKSFCFSAFALQMHELIISVIALIVIIIITSLGLFSQGALNHTFPADMAS